MRFSTALRPALPALILAVLSAPALAQAPAAGAYTVNWAALDPGNDWSATVLKSLFPLPGLTGGQTTGAAATVVSQLAAQFTAFVAAIAMAFFAYNLIMHIFRAAESSQLLGNGQSWMSVVRAGFAAIMMIPVSGGFSSGQWLVMQGALWGAGMAKAAYGFAVNAIGPDAMVIATPMIPGTQSVVAGIISSELCMDLINLASGNATTGTPLVPTPGATLISDSTGGFVSYRYGFSNGDASGTPVCGAITLRQPNVAPSTVAGITVDMASVQSAVLNSVVTGSIRQNVATIAQALWQTKNAAALSGLNTVYTNAVSSYTQGLTAAASAVQSNINSTLAAKTAQARNGALDLSAGATQQSTLGWTAAGAYYLSVARTGASTLSLLTGIPVVTAPSWQGMPISLASDMLPFETQITTYLNTLQTVVNSQDGSTQPTGAPAGLASVQQQQSTSVLDKLFNTMQINGNTINKILAFFGQTNTNIWTDPFGGLMQLGQTLTLTGLAGLGLAAASSSTLGTVGLSAASIFTLNFGALFAALAANAVVNFLALPIFALMLALIMPGLIISYVLPMIPYTLWIAGVTGWIILVCEAMIAVPLWMLAHMTIGGDGLHGRAVEGWGLLFNVMFRPVLMVIGMFLSFFVFSCIAWLTRQSFGIAANFALSGGYVVTNFIGLVVLLNIFVMTQVTAAYMAFRMIALLPHHLPRLIGFSSASRVDMNEFAEKAAVVSGGIIAAGTQQMAGRAAEGYTRGAQRISDKRQEQREQQNGSGNGRSMDSTLHAITDTGSAEDA